METIPRVHVKMGVKKKNAPAVLALARAMYNGLLAASADFPNPPTPLPLLLGQIQAAEGAQQAMPTRAKGVSAVRNAKLAVLVTTMEGLVTYVQSLCDASPEQAASLIAAASLKAVTRATRVKPVLGVKDGPGSGAVTLAAYRKALAGKTGKAVLFNWQYSLDGGKTWQSVAPTTLARTTIQGLTPLTTASFRVAATVGAAAGEWSQAVAHLVH